jgi:hypothetical protein
VIHDALTDICLNLIRMQAYKTFGSRVTAVKKKLDEHRALLRASMSSPDDIDEDTQDDASHQPPDSIEERTSYSDVGGRDYSEDSSNSPLSFINPSDYIDEPLNDEDICE